MLKSKEPGIPSPTYMSSEQMGQQSPMSPYVLPHTPPRASKLRECIYAEDSGSQTAYTASYLSDLRQSRPARPSGARPPPASKFTPSLRRAETDHVANPTPITQERPALPTSSSMPNMPPPKLSHRRTDSDLARRSMCSATGPFAGRPLARPPSMALEETTIEEQEDQPEIRRTPSMPYMENGMRWMEKQEAKSLRQALEDMDLEEERKVHAAAQDEAAELVWRHRNPEQDTAKVFANPDLPRDYRSHLRRGSYQRSHSRDTIPTLERTSSDGSSQSRPDTSTSKASKRVSFEQPRKVSPPAATNVSMAKRRDTSKSYDHLAEAVAKDIAAAHRRSSSGSQKRIISGEKKMFMHPNDRIWEDPQEGESSPPKQQTIVEEPKTSQPSIQPTPSYVRKNPFARVRAHHGGMERSNSAPTISALPVASPPKHDRVEIQRNAPSQVRNPWYMSNEPLPPTPPKSSGHDADEVAPKTTPTRDGKEIRGDDIRAATSKSRKEYSPNLPRPTMVSDKPGRPIVSFQKDYKPKEIVMDGQTVESSSSGRPGSSRGSSTSQHTRAGASAMPEITRISVDEVTKPPIPTINLPDEPSVPTIVLPEEPSSRPRKANPIPTINFGTPDLPGINVSGPEEQTSPTKNRRPQRPLPSTRPLPHHAATAPVPTTKSTPHYTPSIRQSGALCAHCALPIAGRILSAAGERFHPGCFVCHECNTNLECVAFYPEPEKQRAERVERIRARQAGIPPPDEQQFDDGDETLRFYCHLDFHEMFSPRCKSCKTPIEGEVIVACGAEWHVGHFFCAQCGDPFDSTMPFVEKDGYAWCVGCHTNRYSPKCGKCKKPVTDVVVKALGRDWHGGCFTCMECNGEFVDGRYFLRGDSQDPVCVTCEERRLKA